jgi:2-polyprenyl-3-methyl-5-hydroxy-6-metoxy-1,4-benzoquinol methylase
MHERYKGQALKHQKPKQNKTLLPLEMTPPTQVSASDISAAMANEGRERAIAALGKGTANARCTFKTSDLEELSGKYDTVTCVDVMIHYPSDKVSERAAWNWLAG